MRIPRIFHQIWVGPDPFPKEFARYQETWRSHHPDWDLRFWTEENLPADLDRKEAYELLRQPAERADLIRLELLYNQGGVYVDVDFECLRSIEPLLADVDFFVGNFKPRRVTNAIVGSVPGHPLLARAVSEIRPRLTWGAVDKAGTGPSFLGKLVREYPEATVFDSEIFYPRTPDEMRRSYAVHHRARSWRDANGLRKLLVGAEARLSEARMEADEWRMRGERAEAELARLKQGSPSLGRLRQRFARR